MAEALLYHGSSAQGQAHTQTEEGLVLSEELIESFLTTMEENGRSEETTGIYRNCLTRLIQFLPEDNYLDQERLDQWRTSLGEAGLAHTTVSSYVAAASSLMLYFKDPAKVTRQPKQEEPAVEKADVPELSRKEYLRLLYVAREQGKDRTYLLVKLFVSTGLALQDLKNVTVDAVEEGIIPSDRRDPIRIPECLRMELLEYVKRTRISSGPIFITESGKLLRRANINSTLRILCRNAGISESKGNPRCLRRLYHTTRANIQANMENLTNQKMNRILESEQKTIGLNYEERN